MKSVKNQNLKLLSLMVVVVLLAAATGFNFINQAEKAPVKVVKNDDQKKIDVFIDGELFTSYIYPNTIEKPVLTPIKAADGTVITRGYPLDPKPGERVDHPHHVGLWFNYGDVNGLDFWNNSDAIDPSKKDKYGSIIHKSVKKVKSGEEGIIEVEMDWVDSKGKVLLKENTKFVFSGDKNQRTIDRITKLTAQGEDVSMKDNKEGVLGLRVARFLELPSNKPELFTDASGKPTNVPVLNNEGVNGNYKSSEGKEGNDVWGTRGEWVKLYGTKDGKQVSVAIIDHPENPGYPTHWHARGYGLFAANTLGQKDLSGGKNELNFKIPANKSATFKYRVIVHSGSELKDEALNNEFKEFSKVK